MAPSRSGPNWLENESLCLGCGLCVSMSDSGTMVQTDEGFRVPTFDEGDRVLGGEGKRLAQEVCPSATMSLPDSVVKPGVRNAIWGHFIGARRSWSVDPEVRFNGASGGVLTALAHHLLLTDQVTDVVHVKPTTTFADAAGTASETPVAVSSGAGSWYCPSPTLSAFDLPRTQPTAVIGKPCEVSAIRRLQEEGADLGDLTLLSFFCGGLPSVRGSRALAESVGIADEDVVEFRYRGRGWPGAARLETTSVSAQVPYEAAWGANLGREVHPLCKICPDSIGLAADLVVGDAWKIVDGKPAFVDAPGESLVVVRTERGNRLYQEAIASGILEDTDFDLAELELSQRLHLDRRTLGVWRRFGTRLAGVRVPHARRLGLLASTTHSPFLAARNLVGSFRRARRSRQRA